MNWANKLFEKSWYSIEDGGRKDHFYVNDLVLAVLKKNKKIQELPYPELEEYRAWRELVKKCNEVQGE